MKKFLRVTAATITAINIPKIGCAGPNPLEFNPLNVRHPNNAPTIIIPSSAIFITPLLSENIPPKATSIKGIAKSMVVPKISPNKTIILAPPFYLHFLHHYF